MKHKFFLALMSVTVSWPSLAQNTTYFGLFPTIDHSASISRLFEYNVYLFDAIKPYSTDEGDMRDEARSLYAYGEAGLTVKLGKYLAFTNSYVYERQQPFRDDYRNEHRLFQQLTCNEDVGRFRFKQRLRFDERFIENRETGKSPFTHRLRLLMGLRYELNEKGTYFTGYTEFFLNTMPGSVVVYNENWSAAQIGFSLNSNNYVECGLLYVGWAINNNPDWLHQNYLQITWVNRLDFRKEGNQVD